jgi:hypothetical protein
MPPEVVEDKPLLRDFNEIRIHTNYALYISLLDVSLAGACSGLVILSWYAFCTLCSEILADVGLNNLRDHVHNRRTIVVASHVVGVSDRWCGNTYNCWINSVQYGYADVVLFRFCGLKCRHRLSKRARYH